VLTMPLLLLFDQNFIIGNGFRSDCLPWTIFLYS
jgi:hypothetical protein